MVHVPDSLLCQGYPDNVQSTGTSVEKETYCPDEPRGWTPRLTIYDNELAYSCNTKVASSYNTVTLVEDDTLVDQQSRSRRGGESRYEIHLILELLD